MLFVSSRPLGDCVDNPSCPGTLQWFYTLLCNADASQEDVMAYSSSRLPSRFPVGTKFVIEGRPAREGQVQVVSRYLEFPDGTFLPLPKRTLGPARRIRRRLRPRGN